MSLFNPKRYGPDSNAPLPPNRTSHPAGTCGGCDRERDDPEERKCALAHEATERKIESLRWRDHYESALLAHPWWETCEEYRARMRMLGTAAAGHKNPSRAKRAFDAARVCMLPSYR